jgi:hypothetical protein
MRFSMVVLMAAVFLGAPAAGAAQALPIHELAPGDDFEEAIAASRDAVRRVMAEASVPGAS